MSKKSLLEMAEKNLTRMRMCVHRLHFIVDKIKN